MKKVLVVLALIAMTGIASADMITDAGIDGGFESATDDGWGSMVPNGTGVWASDWGNIDHEWLDIADGTDTYDPAGSIPFAADGTTPHGGSYMWMLAGGNASPSVGYTLELPSAAGNLVTFGAWIKADATNAPSRIEMGIDMIDAGYGWQGNEVVEISITDVWAYYEVTVPVTAATATMVKPKIGVFGTAAAMDGVAYTDDWTATQVVPEPATMALLGLGGLLLRRRK